MSVSFSLRLTLELLSASLQRSCASRRSRARRRVEGIASQESADRLRPALRIFHLHLFASDSVRQVARQAAFMRVVQLLLERMELSTGGAAELMASCWSVRGLLS